MADQFVNSKPQSTVILGPPSSGKTALVRQAVLAMPGLNPVVVDLRRGNFENVDTTTEWIKTQFERLSDTLSKKLPTVEAVRFQDLAIEKGEEQKQFHKLLNEISDKLPDWGVLKGYGIPKPVLIVDEANRFISLVRTEGGGETDR